MWVIVLKGLTLRGNRAIMTPMSTTNTTATAEFNPHEELNRTRKAAKLALLLTAQGFEADDLELVGAQALAGISEALGINPPSDETFKVTLDLMRWSEDKNATIGWQRFASAH